MDSNFLASIGTIAGQNPFLAYFIIYLATIFLGNISAFASFWFVFRGYLGPWGIPVLVLVLFCSNATGDLLWYSLGRFTRSTKFGNWVHRRLPPWKTKIERGLSHNGRKWIILSKFAYAAFPVTFTAGWVKMDFKRYLRNSFISIVLWLPILLGLTFGLVSGLSPLAAISLFRGFELLFVIGLAAFLFLDFIFSRLLERVLAREGDDEVG